MKASKTIDVFHVEQKIKASINLRNSMNDNVSCETILPKKIFVPREALFLK